MNKHIFLLGLGLLAGLMMQAAESESAFRGIGYELVEQGYLDQPMATAVGIIATNDRQSEIYKVENGTLRTLVASRGCGRYTMLNGDRTLLGFKSIDDNGYQAPAVLNLQTEQVTLLDDYMFQCGQVSFSQDGSMAYTADEELVIVHPYGTERFDLGYYTNIVRLSPDGQTVAFSNPNGKPMLLTRATGKVEALSDISDLYDPRFSPDGSKIIWQRGDASLYVTDLTARHTFFLDKGFGALWKNSDEIVYSHSEYINDDVFLFAGISVCTSSWNGAQRRVLIASSMECPEQVGLTDDGQLLIPYAYGNRRLVEVSLQQPQSEKVVCQLPEWGKHFGFVPASLKETDVVENPHIRKATSTMGGTIGIHDIPYINQTYDVPDSYAGCHDYGPVACAPSTACMLLAYLGYFEKHAVTSRYANCPWGKTNYYSWYVGQEYTSQTGYVFNIAAQGCGCMAKGGYGYMWGLGSPSSQMCNFYTNNGIPTTMSSQQWTIPYTTIKDQCDNDHPYSWCITSGKSSGHLILPFRCNAKCVKVSGVWTLKEGAVGSMVVQDPYGDANSSPWVGDGRYSTYDYQGYNNGYYTMVSAWGITVTKRPAATVQLLLNPTSLKFKNVMVGDSASKIVSVTGKNLTDSIRVTSITGTGASVFRVSPMVLPKEGGDLRVTFVPTKAAQRTATVTIVSTGAEDAVLKLDGGAILNGEETVEAEDVTPRRVLENGRVYILLQDRKFDILGNQK